MKLYKQILETLVYFDLFHYPVTSLELYQFLPNNCDYIHFCEVLRRMVDEKVIFKLEEYYSLENDTTKVALRRVRNQKARQLMGAANKAANLLSHFPFVKGIAISGSLSKNCADENSDIDFFLIIEKNKLWLARTLLHVFKKLTFLINKQHLFCMNYFIDEEILEIEEKNIYTATEIMTLLPFHGKDVFDNFFSRNRWASEFLPNYLLNDSYLKPNRSYLLKRALEWILRIPLTSKLEDLLLSITSKRWNQKLVKGKKNNHGLPMSMVASRHCCKPDPVHFQDRILTLFHKKKDEVIQKACMQTVINFH